MDMVDIKDNKGSSLVELVVSIAILGIILLPILNKLLYRQGANAESRVQTQKCDSAGYHGRDEGQETGDIIGNIIFLGMIAMSLYIRSRNWI